MTSAADTPNSASAEPPGEDTLLLDAARSRVLRRLGSTLRHDLNSPLQAAVWAFDLIERGVTSHPDAEQRAKLLTSVGLGRRELARLQKAVRQFVACAAPLDEDRESFDLRDVLADVESMVGADASLHDVQIEFAVHEAPLPMSGVRHQIQQALLLLTIEALDASHPGGTVEVQPSRRDERIEVQVSHGRNGAAPAAGPAVDLAQRVIATVAAAHGGNFSRSEDAERCQSLLVLAARREAG